MRTLCVMCEALGHAGCVAGCHYAALVEQGVVNPLQLKSIIYIYNLSYVHGKMTSAAEEERASVMRSFVYYTRARFEDMIRGAEGVKEKLTEELAERRAEARKLEEEVATLTEHEHEHEHSVERDEKLKELGWKEGRVAAIEAEIAAIPSPP